MKPWPYLRLAGVVLLCFVCRIAGADLVVTTDQLSLQFSDSGNLLSARACIPDCLQPGAKTGYLGSESGLLRLSTGTQALLHPERTESADTIHLKFSNEDTGAILSWTIPRQGWLLKLDANQVVNAQIDPGPKFAGAPSSGFGQILERVRYVAIRGKAVITSVPDEPSTETFETDGWFGIRNRFWAVLVKPTETVSAKNRHGAHAELAQISIESGEVPSFELLVYTGPVEPEALAGAAPELRKLMYSGLWPFLRWICQGLFHLFKAIHAVIPHWPTAIVVLSISVSILMRPLSRAAERLQEDVNTKQAILEPRLRSIKRESVGEQQAERTLALYKSEGIHPLYSLKSLAGVMLVLPVFIGAFDMLAENIWLSGESFLWVRDLSLPDSVMTLPFSLPFLGNQLNVLPCMMTALSVYASVLHQPSGHDLEMHRSRIFKLTLLALAFLALFYTFPAGMVLYWTSNNLLSVIKALYTKRMVTHASTRG